MPQILLRLILYSAMAWSLGAALVLVGVMRSGPGITDDEGHVYNHPAVARIIERFALMFADPGAVAVIGVWLLGILLLGLIALLIKRRTRPPIGRR